MANASEHGLVAAVFTRSLQRAWHFAERLESGSVVVNDTSNYWELHLPFGGRAGRSSGRGRLGGRHTLEEFTAAQDHQLRRALSAARRCGAGSPRHPKRGDRPVRVRVAPLREP